MIAGNLRFIGMPNRYVGEGADMCASMTFISFSYYVRSSLASHGLPIPQQLAEHVFLHCFAQLRHNIASHMLRPFFQA
jgi:hypothetical protein